MLESILYFKYLRLKVFCICILNTFLKVFFKTLVIINNIWYMHSKVEIDLKRLNICLCTNAHPVPMLPPLPYICDLRSCFR